MSEVIYRDGWPFPANEINIIPYGVNEPLEGEEDKRIPFTNLYKKYNDLNMVTDVPAILATSESEIYRPREYSASFFSRYYYGNKTPNLLTDVDAMLECGWNTTVPTALIQPKTDVGFQILHLDKVLFRDDVSNRIERIFAMTVNRTGYNSRNYPYDSYRIVELPVERSGDVILADVREVVQDKGVRVIFGFNVVDNTIPLNLYQMTYLRRDRVREMANVDASEGYELVGNLKPVE